MNEESALVLILDHVVEKTKTIDPTPTYQVHYSHNKGRRCMKGCGICYSLKLANGKFKS